MEARFLCLIAIFGVALGGWGPKLKLFNYDYENTIIRNYLDTSTGFTHSVMGSNKEGILYYRRFNQENVLSETQVIKLGHVTLYNPHIQGLNDGKTLYIAMTLIRKGTKEICETDSESCADVYFIQSTNGGETWSNIQQVMRRNMDDRLSRYVMKLFINPLNSRIWIFYLTVDKTTDEESVRFVTKEYSSVALRPEQIAISNFADHTDESLMFRILNGNPVIDLFFRFRSDYKTVVRLRSVNNGATWSRENFPTTSFCFEGDSFDGLYGADRAAYGVLIKRCYRSGNGWYMETSEDDGKTWAHRTFLDAFMIVNDFLFSGSSDNIDTLRAFVYGQNAHDGYRLFEWKVGKGTFTPIDPAPDTPGVSVVNRNLYHAQFYHGGHHLYRSIFDFTYHTVYVYRDLPQGS